MKENEPKSESMPQKEIQKKETKKASSEAKEVPDFPSILEGAPPDLKAAIQMMRVTSMGGPSPNPLLEKFTEEHIHKYLDYIQRDDDHEFELRSSSRWFHSFYLVLALSAFLFLVIYLAPLDKTLLSDIIKVIVSFAGGLGGGFGLKAYLDRK